MGLWTLQCCEPLVLHPQLAIHSPYRLPLTIDNGNSVAFSFAAVRECCRGLSYDMHDPCRISPRSTGRTVEWHSSLHGDGEVYGSEVGEVCTNQRMLWQGKLAGSVCRRRLLVLSASIPITSFTASVAEGSQIREKKGLLETPRT